MVILPLRVYCNHDPPIFLWPHFEKKFLEKFWGIENIYEYVSPLHDQLREGIEAMGGRVVTPAKKSNHGAMIAVASNNENAHVSALEGEKVITSCRDGNVRISPHFYNNYEDVERVLASLAKHRTFLSK